MARGELNDLRRIILRLEERRGLIRVTSEVAPGDVRLKDARALLDELA